MLQDADYNNRWQKGDYDMDIEGSVVDADPDDNDYNFFYPDGPWNTGKWNRPQAKALLDDERAITDQAKRAKDFQDLQDLARKEAAFGFLYHAYFLPGYQSYVKGLPQDPGDLLHGKRLAGQVVRSDPSGGAGGELERLTLVPPPGCSDRGDAS